MNRILIDANIYSHAMVGTAEVLSELQRTGEIGISVVSIGELLSGFRAGTKEKKNRAEIGEFLDSPRVRIYLIDETTAEFYAEILSQLKKDGTPIPTNDIWNGAVALQNGLKLFTKGQHFQRILGLALVS